MHWPDIPAPILTALASFVGAWLAAQFALRRFYREKVWERKTAAYTAIFEALHQMGRWFDEHISEIALDRELPKERAAELFRESRAAEALLDRRLASETWLIPDPIRGRIADGLIDLRRAYNFSDWSDHLIHGTRAIRSLTDDLRRSVRDDLHLRSPFLLRARIRKRQALKLRRQNFRAKPPDSHTEITDSTPGPKPRGN
jgi:hypothetical protein